MDVRRLKIGDEELAKIIKTLSERHHAHVKPGEVFELEGYMNHGEAYARLWLRDPEETQVLSMEARVDLIGEDIQNPDEGKMHALDILDLGLQEYFSTSRTWKPSLDWKAHKHDGVDVYFRGSVRNLKLEKMASELLGEPLEDF